MSTICQNVDLTILYFDLNNIRVYENCVDQTLHTVEIQGDDVHMNYPHVSLSGKIHCLFIVSCLTHAVSLDCSFEFLFQVSHVYKSVIVKPNFGPRRNRNLSLFVFVKARLTQEFSAKESN